MSGVAVVWSLLKTNAAVLAVAPAACIKPGILPENATPPVISIIQIDGIPSLTVAMNEPSQMITERVQVTVLTKSYQSKKSLLHLVTQALPDTKGTVNGVHVDSILPDSYGPDMDDTETSMFIQSRDFFVRWHETR